MRYDHYGHEPNLVYFEASSMKELQEDIRSWQYSRDGKWLSSLSIEKDDDKFYCIGVLGPLKVEVVSGTYGHSACESSRDTGYLNVRVVN